MNPRLTLAATVIALHLGAAHAQDPHAHTPAADTRAILPLTPDERAVLLDEMHRFLDGVQKITAALGREDMPAVVAAARGVGQKMAHEVPPALRAKLPMEFRQLGASVHGDFDQIALDAESLKDVSYSLSQLSATLQKCVSCHTMYQIQGPALNARH
ncbi:MAG: hypothetical protein K0M48_14425 [Thiobacillus sp.]|nr:hypothetical protein [Thiobacillus sp.]